MIAPVVLGIASGFVLPVFPCTAGKLVADIALIIENIGIFSEKKTQNAIHSSHNLLLTEKDGMKRRVFQ